MAVDGFRRVMEADRVDDAARPVGDAPAVPG